MRLEKITLEGTEYLQFIHNGEVGDLFLPNEDIEEYKAKMLIQSKSVPQHNFTEVYLDIAS